MRRSSLGVLERLPPNPGRQGPCFEQLIRLAAASALFSGLCLAPPALALQLVDARDGLAVEATLSVREPTRIRIEGAPITDVFGSIHSSNCGGGTGAGASALSATAPGLAGMVSPAAPSAAAVNPAGEIVLECDRDKGEIYIRPVLRALDPKAKPVNLFVASAHATYTLVLRRADTPADTIVIRDRTLMARSPGPNVPRVRGDSAGSAPSHIRAMKQLLVAMASDRVQADIRIEELNRPFTLWPETGFTLIRRYEGRGLVGERYLLHNAGQTALDLTEQAFDRQDSAASPTGGQVLGVSIEHHHLRPGHSTSVFVIRRGVAP